MLAPWKKSYDQPREHIKKQRHYFARKVHLVRAMVFRVVMYGCESWTIKKAEHRRIDAFELWLYMEFRKMLMITLYAEQKKKKRHRFIEQSFRLCGRRRGWDVSREQH